MKYSMMRTVLRARREDAVRASDRRPEGSGLADMLADVGGARARAHVEQCALAPDGEEGADCEVRVDDLRRERQPVVELGLKGARATSLVRARAAQELETKGGRPDGSSRREEGKDALAKAEARARERRCRAFRLAVRPMRRGAPRSANGRALGGGGGGGGGGV
eukprot:6121342-Pleurochrysis_carterae.AAC.2